MYKRQLHYSVTDHDECPVLLLDRALGDRRAVVVDVPVERTERRARPHLALNVRRRRGLSERRNGGEIWRGGGNSQGVKCGVEGHLTGGEIWRGGAQLTGGKMWRGVANHRG